MKWTIDYKTDKPYIRVDSEGKFDHQQHKQKMDELVAKDYWKPGTNILFDCTKVDFSGIGLADVREIVYEYCNRKELMGRGKVAMLMKSMADFGRGRQIQMLAEDRVPIDVGIFVDEKKALDWLEA